MRKFCTNSKCTPTRPPATANWSPEIDTRAVSGRRTEASQGSLPAPVSELYTTPVTCPPLPPRKCTSARATCLSNFTATLARLPSLKSEVKAETRYFPIGILSTR